MRLYISGCISVDPDGFKAKFAAAEETLRAAGYDVFNPGATEEVPGWEWLDYMRLDVAELAYCDGIATIPGWEAGGGTWVEVNLAHGLRLPVRPVDSWKALSQ